MATLHDDVLDGALAVVQTQCNAIHVCSQQPTTYAEVATYSRGSKSSPTIGSPTNGVSNGRRIIFASFTDGTTSSTGNVTHLAMVATGTSKLLATKALVATQYVNSGDPLSMGSFSLTAPDIT